MSRAGSEPQNSSAIDQKKGQTRAPHLSPEQAAAVQHVWNSPDRVILIRGGAGTGKTHMMKAAIAGIDKPVVVLAPPADASRGVLRKEGFAEADTLARLLILQL
jgi:superfamily II DNA or RNA helicase